MPTHNEKVIQNFINQIYDGLENILKKNMEKIEEYYENNRDFYEIVQLKSETKEPINKRVETELIFEDIDKQNYSFNVYLRATTTIGRKVLEAQNIGTGLDMPKEVLDFFEVDDKEDDDKENEENNMHDRYFDPKNINIVFRNDIKTLVNAVKG